MRHGSFHVAHKSKERVIINCKEIRDCPGSRQTRSRSDNGPSGFVRKLKTVYFQVVYVLMIILAL